MNRVDFQLGSKPGWSDKPTGHQVTCAIVGIGAKILSKHAPALQSVGLKLIGAVDTDVSLGRKISDQMNVPCFPRVEDLLQSMKPDLVIILTPPNAHAPLAISAIQAGCHVLVEKPMALSVSEADAMIRVANQSGKLLATVFQHRFRPEVMTARSIIGSGALGTMQRIELFDPSLRTSSYFGSASWRGTWSGEGGGVLMNQAPHALDLLCHLVGLPQRILAMTAKLQHSIQTEDTAHALLEWQNGAIGHAMFSTAQVGQRYLEISGTHGAIRLSWNSLLLTRFSTSLPELISSKGLNSEVQEDLSPLSPVAEDLHVAVYRHILNCLNQMEICQLDGIQARMSLELANSILISGYQRRAVELPLNRQEYDDFLRAQRLAR